MATGLDVRENAASPSPARRRRRRAARVAAYSSSGVLLLGVIAWIGLRPEPGPLPGPAITAGPVAHVPVPDDLPEPVDRFYRTLYGDRIPVVETAVISGRGQMRIAGITFPARFRFSHIAGRSYRHHIELTWFGRGVLQVDEWFLDGHAKLDLPFGVVEGPNTDQGANLALWAEAVWFPSIWLTDPRVRWEPVDASSARLIVPFGDETETLTVAFDQDTGLLARMESLRFKDETDAAKVRWMNGADDWGARDGVPVPLRTSVTWADEGTPWARLHTEEIVLNADLDRYIEQQGP